jgi:hypothetical protein
MKSLVLTAIAVSLVAGCTMTPVVTRQKTFMTRAQIAAMNLECKRWKPIDSIIPKTICASEASWDAYLKKTSRATEELFAEARKLGNR